MSDGSQIDGFWAVIPAGGAGTRLWPLSRKGSPKFLHDLTGSGRTLLQSTWDRVLPLAGSRIVVVTGRDHAPEVGRQLPGLDAAYLLAEPSPRDSMPAIAWAAAVVAARDPEAVIGSFHADHVITGVALGMHLFHGVWSGAQTLGWTNTATTRRLAHTTAHAVAGIVDVGFLLPPLAILFGLVK